jgi:hypothetical protein
MWHNCLGIQLINDMSRSEWEVRSSEDRPESLQAERMVGINSDNSL